eukprot:evm.model.NODE_4663_length_47357_cov_23.541208.8
MHAHQHVQHLKAKVPAEDKCLADLKDVGDQRALGRCPRDGLLDLIQPVRFQCDTHGLIEGAVFEAALEHLLHDNLQPRVDARSGLPAQDQAFAKADVLVKGLCHQRLHILRLLAHVEVRTRAQTQTQRVLVLLQVEEDLGRHHRRQLARLEGLIFGQLLDQGQGSRNFRPELVHQLVQLM